MARYVHRKLPVYAAGVVLAAGLASAFPPAVSADPAAHDPGARAGPAVVTVRGADAIPGSYIVVLSDPAATPAAVARDHGVTVRRSWTAALHGFNAAMSADRARELAADPRVRYVQTDARVHLADTQADPPSYGLDRLDQRGLPLDERYTTTTGAANVHAYIIDTGIRLTHETFGGRATFGYNAVDTNDADCNGHGTHVAGTVGGREYGVAKAVRLVAVKVLDCEGSGSTAQVVDGVNWVTAHAVRPAVANMSLGGGVDPAIDSAVTGAIAAGVTFAVASGNDNADACEQSPARVGGAITVNASDLVDARAPFSNWGVCTDLFAPGVGITSAWDTSDTATNRISGTSMATPHATGAAALYLATHPTATPAQVSTALTGNATPGLVGDPGDGSPNLLLYTGTAPVPPPPPPPVCAFPGQRLTNGGFESGDRGWLATAGVLGNPAGEVPHSGTRYAWLNGYGREHTDRVRQTVTIPYGCVRTQLTFWLRVDTAELTQDTAFDTLSVEVSTARPTWFSNLTATEHPGYHQYSIPVGHFAGQTVTITFTGNEDTDAQTSYVLDDISVLAQ